MAREIGSWWLSNVVANSGEQVLWSKGANHTQGTGRAAGGKLFVTNQRVIFCPHLLAALLKGRKVSIPLEDITAVGTDEASSSGLRDTLFGGGLRVRLRIERANGDVDLFVVNDLGAAIDQIRANAEIEGSNEEGSEDSDAPARTVQ